MEGGDGEVITGLSDRVRGSVAQKYFSTNSVSATLTMASSIGCFIIFGHSSLACFSGR